MSHQCDCEPACPSLRQCEAARGAGAEVGTAVGGEADKEAGTAVCTEAEVGSEAVVWLPVRGWRRPRRRWKSPGRCG